MCDFFSTLSFLYLFSVSIMPSQTYDDIDLENEPWYKFFSELEFGRPVSEGHSSPPRSHPSITTPVGRQPLSPLLSVCVCFLFILSTNRLSGASCFGMCYLLGPCDRLCYVSALPGFLVWWQQALKCSRTNLDVLMSLWCYWLNNRGKQIKKKTACFRSFR